MTTETLDATEIPDTTGLLIDPATAALLFTEARTVNGFADGDVADAQVQAAYDLVRWGPTAMNTVPLRILLVRSPEARERLAGHMAEGNRARVLAAPLTVVVAADTDFHEHLPRLAPHMEGGRERFAEAGTAGRAPMATQSTNIQIGYLIVGLRAAGLHVGAMGGFDHAGVDAEFFADNGWQSQLVINVGTPAAEGASRPRQERLAFDEVSATV
ncbi:nitroreductase family protein [Paraoerskovia sediminicola]|uniref:Nitroreductase family protein n=1 Tax=Paraoerskovia sediminicola TaxID=1138587 RepID=A0ABM8FZB0_9CELL|nr:malonic semialdehyde reductase [Paraoerskovia sediminicola]BDZ41150.1 nitroreductase family protein [Paraoerskovia sediminicola]